MKKSTRKLLYIIFTLLIIVSGVIFYFEYTKQQEEPEIYDPTPSEIAIEEDEKEEVVVEQKTTIKMAPDVDLDAERKKYNNNDIIGRLEIPDLFNVLVVRGTDNKYYLNHAVDKKADIRGSEFMDYRLTPTSKQVNIYGHNSRDPKIKVAFLKLEKFLDKDFFDANPYIIFQYDGGKSIYKIRGMRQIYESNTDHLNKVHYTGQEFVKYVNELTGQDGRINYRDVPVDENSEILVLQTCSHDWDKALYLITAVKIKYYIYD